jgi:RNA polymerase sigma factor (sigma-70 family)
MDKLEKIVANFLSSKFDEWKPYLNTNEQAVFILYYFKGYKIFQIAMEINYSEIQVKRILKSARKKINKLLP